MKNRWNAWLLLGTVVPLVLHYWPFAYWSGTTLVILRIVSAFCGQTLLCRVGKRTAIQAIPLLITGALALWIGYLYLIPQLPTWAVLRRLFWEYFSPFISCALVYGLFRRRE